MSYAVQDGTASRVDLSGDVRHRQWAAAPRFQTQTLSEAQGHLRQFEASTVLDVSCPGDFEGYSESVIPLNTITLSKTVIGAADGYDLSFRPHGQYSLNIPLRGRGWIAVGSQMIELRAGDAALIAPSCPVQKHWLGSSDVLTVHIPAPLLTTGPWALPADTPALTVIGPDDVVALMGLLTGFWTAPPNRARIGHPSVTIHLEAALLALLVRIVAPTDDDQTSMPVSPAVPYYVRRAQHYMRANFRPGVTLDDIVQAAGVSRRSLQYGFKYYCGVSPTQFFRKMRLDCARDALLGGQGHRMLSQVAWDAGYNNSSHFSTDYRAMFGEAPSQTLARAERRIDADCKPRRRDPRLS